MEPVGQPPGRARSSLVSARLIVRPLPWDAVRAISGGSRLDDWAADYPSEGDVIIAGLLQDAGPWPTLLTGPGGTARWSSGTAAWWSAGSDSSARRGGAGWWRLVTALCPRGKAAATPARPSGPCSPWRGRIARVTAVVAGTDPGNAASQRVLEKAGFRRIAGDGEFRYRLAARRQGQRLSKLGPGARDRCGLGSSAAGIVSGLGPSVGWIRRRAGPRPLDPARQDSREFVARVDAELLVHVAQVVLDGLRAQEQRGRGLPGGLPPGEQDGDLQLLRGQLVERVRVPARRVSPVAASSARARSAQGCASRRSNTSAAARSCSRARTRLRARRSRSP